MTITIGISDETWKELISRKQPGESFDTIIQNLIKKEVQNDNRTA